jgi:hypothetical protein
MNNITLLTNSLLFLFLITGCSTNEELYNEYNKDVFSCDKQAAQHREACIDHINKNKSYDEYRQQRKALLK